MTHKRNWILILISAVLLYALFSIGEPGATKDARLTEEFKITCEPQGTLFGDDPMVCVSNHPTNKEQ